MNSGSQTNSIPLSHFRCLFPQLCNKDGNPKENALEPTLAQFEAYDGGILHSHRWIILPTQDIKDNKKFHPVRYYVVTREEARILISHATATWLGLLKVLCPNKVPEIKRQVASVSNKPKEPSDQSNNNLLSGPQHPSKVKYTILTSQHPPKVKYSETVTAKQQQDERPTLKQHSHGRKCHRGKPVHREVDCQVASQSVESHSFHVDAKGARSLGGRQSMLSRQISIPSQSEIKSASNNHYCSSTFRTSTPKVKYWDFCQNDHTTSYRRTRKLTISTLRAISSATRTYRTLSKPPSPRSFLGPRSTLSFTNLAQSRSAV